MSETESFESVYERLYSQLHNPCGLWKAATIAEWLVDLERAHEREIRDTAQREFARGMDAGKHSMDAEHRAVAMRLRALPLDGGSHENLSQIARAVYHSDWGWTQGACAALRDELVRLMGGVSDDTCDSQCCGACADSDGRDSGEHAEVSDGGTGDSCTRSHPLRSVGRNDVCVCRDSGEHSGEQEVGHGGAAHDCADDSSGGSGSELVHMDGLEPTATVTGDGLTITGEDGDELRIVKDDILLNGKSIVKESIDGFLGLTATYDVLWNERRKAVCELRNMHLDTGSAVKKLAIALGVKWNSDNAVRSVTLLQKRLIHLLGGDQPSGIDVLRGADLSKKSVDAMSSRAEGQSQDDALMRVRLNAKTYAYQILELAGILGVDVNVGDNVADIGNAVMAKARHLADECNFSTPENDMDTEDAKPNPAETSDDEIDHVSFGTRSITNGTTGQPNGTCPDDVPMASITDELREWASYRHCKGMSHTDVLNIGFIANRIDEQFGRICQQQETVLQKTVDGMVREYEHDRESDQLRIEKLERQRDHWRQQTTDMMNHADAMEHERDEAYARTDELSDELLRVIRERDELRAAMAIIREAVDG